MTTDRTLADTSRSPRGVTRDRREPPGFSPCLTAVVIDAEEAARTVLVHTLEAAGYATDACAEGAEGVETVLATSPDLVTVDLNLPGMDGVEVIRRIRAAGATPHVAVISASQDEADKVLGFTAGADDYITKPFRIREFRARIDAVTRRLTRAPRETHPA